MEDYKGIKWSYEEMEDAFINGAGNFGGRSRLDYFYYLQQARNNYKKMWEELKEVIDNTTVVHEFHYKQIEQKHLGGNE